MKTDADVLTFDGAVESEAEARAEAALPPDVKLYSVRILQDSSRQTIEASGASADEARQTLRGRLPEGLEFSNEFVQPGTSGELTVGGYSSEEARTHALTML